MEKKNWMDEDIRCAVDIHRYFNKDLPIRFDRIQNEFNIEIIGFVFVILSLALTIISGVDYFVKSKDVLKDM